MSAMHTDLSAARLQIPVGAASRWAMIFGGIGLLGLAATASGFFSEATRMESLSAYLVAFFYVLTLAVGTMFFAALQHLVGARWSVVLRRIAENYGSFTPWLILLFVPIAVFAKDILPWMNIEGIKNPEYRQAVTVAMESKTWYLTVPFFYGRAAFYLVFWALAGLFYYRKSVEVDTSGDAQAILQMRKFAPPVVILFGLTLSFAAFDWLMGVDPTWATTMFGVYAFAGTILSTLGLIAATARTLHGYGYMEGVITDEHFHDLGKLMFGFTVFWAYIAYSMFMLIWYASLPEETVWYRKHWENGWSTLTWTLILLHFLHRPHRPGLLVGELDDVEAELGLHQFTDLAGLHRERRGIELGHHAATAEEVEVAAVAGVRFILGVFLRQFGEVGAGLCFLQHILRLRLHCRLVLAFGLEEDVARAHLLGR